MLAKIFDCGGSGNLNDLRIRDAQLRPTAVSPRISFSVHKGVIFRAIAAILIERHKPVERVIDEHLWRFAPKLRIICDRVYLQFRRKRRVFGIFMVVAPPE